MNPKKIRCGGVWVVFVAACFGMFGCFRKFESAVQVDGVEDPSHCVPFDKEPVCIKMVTPVYPEIARTDSIEGKVIAYLWVNKEGNVGDVQIIRSDSEVFNQSVIDAAKQFKFTPAMYKNEPVSVWLADILIKE